MVCSRKRKGGWSVRCLSAMNKALLCKWSWCFSNEKRAFWRQVISQKYGENEGEWHFSEVRDGHGVGLWKSISKEWDLLSNKIFFLVGNGQIVKFWKDK